MDGPSHEPLIKLVLAKMSGLQVQRSVRQPCKFWTRANFGPLLKRNLKRRLLRGALSSNKPPNLRLNTIVKPPPKPPGLGGYLGLCVDFVAIVRPNVLTAWFPNVQVEWFMKIREFLKRGTHQNPCSTGQMREHPLVVVPNILNCNGYGHASLETLDQNCLSVCTPLLRFDDNPNPSKGFFGPWHMCGFRPKTGQTTTLRK